MVPKIDIDLPLEHLEATAAAYIKKLEANVTKLTMKNEELKRAIEGNKNTVANAANVIAEMVRVLRDAGYLYDYES